MDESNCNANVLLIKGYRNSIVGTGLVLQEAYPGLTPKYHVFP